MKKRYLGLLALATILTSGLAVVNEYNENEVVDAEEFNASVLIADYADAHGWQNSINYNTINLDDNVTVTFSGTAGSKYYTSGEALRLYQNQSPEINVSVVEGCNLQSVKFTYTTEKTGCITYAGNNISSGTLVEVSGMSATFGVGNTTGSVTNGQARITKIEVSYTSNNALVDKTDEVEALFNTYYHDGDYTKTSTLYLDEIAENEVAKYFHGKADTKFRQTVYEGTSTGTTKLTMTTSEDGKSYDSDESIYVNKNGGGVEHYTNTTYDYTVSGMYGNENRNSVEDWFVTLYDFANSGITTGWTGSNGLYTYDLTSTKEDLAEEKMTRMAREFVAPMWLAPSVNNYNYAKFDKLTVKVDTDDNLVMQLHVEEDTTGITEDDTTLFSQVVISRNHSLGNPVDLQDGTHQQTCTTNGCGVALPPVDHNFGSGTTCECGAVKSSKVISKLDRVFTGVTSGSTNYKDWTNSINGISFAGQSAGSNDSIQLRSKNNNSGIVVTTNANEKVKKITIEWQSSTTNGNKLDVYGKNTAYSAVTDLYDSSKQGTKLGSIVKGTSTELIIEGDYKYIGLRSNNGALYISLITIECE